MPNPPRKRIKYQKFGLIYSGEAVFTNANNQPGVPAGSVARITIPITTRPYALTGVRIRNLVPIPAVVDFEGQQVAAPALVDYFDRLNDDQDVTIDLSQQNVVVRPTNQALMQGAKGIHWHPFACPYPMRGGNNVVVDVKRRTAYPEEVGQVTCQVALVGWQYVNSAALGGTPPSTGFDDVSDAGAFQE